MNSKGNALLTGATSVLGKRLARYLAEQGYNILLHYHNNEEAATKLATELVNEFDISASICPADFLQTDEVNRVVEWVAEHPGKLQVVIHTIGPFGPYAPLADYTLEDYDVVMNGNLRSTFQLLQGLTELLPPSSNVIVFSAVTADQLLPRKFTAVYHVAKYGINTLVQSYAAEWAEKGITINAIAPGILETSVITKGTEQHEYATLADVQTIITYILSEKTTDISGQIFPVSKATLENISR